MVGLETQQQVGGQQEQRTGGRRGRAAQSSVRNGSGATVLGFADYGKESEFKGCNKKPLEFLKKKNWVKFT